MNLSAQDRIALGRAARAENPRKALAEVGKPERDPVALLRLSSRGRVATMVPMRYGRMLESPFAFMRGSAILQTHDLAQTPHSGLVLQICGDCHLANFGGFAVPGFGGELFDVNDFDETAPGPWEWDVKRLAASFVVASRQYGFSKSEGAELVRAMASSYCTRMAAYADMPTLELWYEHPPFRQMLREVGSAELLELIDRDLTRALNHERYDSTALPRLAEETSTGWRLRDTPPTLFHLYGKDSLLPKDDDWHAPGNWRALIGPLFQDYLKSLVPDRARLLSNFTLQDAAFKVVGVGSVGTRCLIVLLTDLAGNPLYLQFKEAGQSVVSRYFRAAGKPRMPRPRHAGQRVVEGQRLMQVVSDPFLGWGTGPAGRAIYGRQLRDLKIGAQPELYKADMFMAYARLCGWALARAHAKNSGMALELSGYLGRGGALGDVMVRYAAAYADQVERDFAAFRAACRSGKLPAHPEH